MSYLELENKRVIVSGAANGIGAAIVHSLLKEGAFPIGIDIQPLKGSELEREINDLWKVGESFEFIEGDASDMEDMSRRLGRFDKLDGLVNNAGLLGNDSSHGGRNIEALSKMIRAHVYTALVLTELAYPRMGSGSSIVNIGSIEVDMAAPNVVLYATAKGALLGMTRAYSVSLAPAIRVNMVSPGSVNTKRNKAQFTTPEGQELIQRFELRTPLGRGVEPAEVADTVLYFLSGRSSAITGQNVIVDGGYTRAL